jgi:NAD(P)-dependent dehydrogenase (short-subunit alcohol dehydrogenase family)
MEGSIASAPRASGDFSQQLAGTVALVTGGGRGLGEAICRVLASSGVTVVPVDFRGDSIERLAATITAEGGRAAARRLDVTDDQAVIDAVEGIVSDFGRLDFVINNAGTDLTVSIEEMPIAEWDRILAVNLRAPFVLAKHALPVMRRAGRGHIVNIASTAAKRAWANASAYHASKWGLLGFSHALHVEARASNVKVTAVVCGGMRTPFLLDRFPDIDTSTLQDPRNVAETVRYVLAQPAETVIPEVMVLPMRETSWP